MASLAAVFAVFSCWRLHRAFASKDTRSIIFLFKKSGKSGISFSTFSFFVAIVFGLRCLSSGSAMLKCF